MLQAILKAQGPLKSPLDTIWPVSIQYVAFKGGTMHVTAGFRYKMLTLYDVKL